MNENKYILITGVAGLLGSKFADYIINNTSYKVIGIDNLFGGYIENINKDVIFFKRDLVYDDISDIFEKYNIEYVYHFAAYAAEGLSPFIRKFNWMNNSVSTAAIINACINYNIKRLIYTSSMSVYGHGNLDYNRFDENDNPNPIDPYGISKYACEMDIIVANQQHNLDYCIIRPHNIYGENQNIWDSYRNVLGIWIYNILHNNPILVYGDGNQSRAFTYIDDILQPLLNAAILPEASKQIINLGGITEYTINKAAQILMKITNYDKIEYKESRHEVKWAIPTYQKSIDLLKFEHKTSLENGLHKMFEWAKQQPDRPKHMWDNYEINKGIYSYWKK